MGFGQPLGRGGQGKERPVYCRGTEWVNGLGEREGMSGRWMKKIKCVCA